MMIMKKRLSYSRSDWIRKKIEIALKLWQGECGASYAEAIIILSAAISALAAQMWPGERIDKQRFVELLKDCLDVRPNPTRVSVPLLIDHLRDNKLASEAETLQKEFAPFQDTLVLSEDRIDCMDRSEAEILSVCPTLPRRTIRLYSYAHILYKEVRSGYVHEYSLSDKADSVPHHSARESAISYRNWASGRTRRIYFNVNWVADVAESLAKEVDSMSSSLPMAQPSPWWLDEFKT
jgi:hypothetical protein